MSRGRKEESQSAVNEVLRASVSRRSRLESTGLARWVNNVPLEKSGSFLLVGGLKGGSAPEKMVDFLDFVDNMEDMEAVIILMVMEGEGWREIKEELKVGQITIEKALTKAREFFE